ncbi:MurG-like transferase [Botrimarina colliarenosi]|uniref:MurG-like transferase n=1 Tax=Botrimarina colliarenosi TaxID=2528001 RepID=A0A5C6A0K5_9BACT|nr:nucleotide disphospho-sugar-binding domain-containing protein [Botrimarina colliarenosi]TWT93362.1 MurG-like transferase [Botrimarina colliarenosi]
MPKTLFAWEMGGGLGHAGPLRAVGAELVRRGDAVTLATTNVPLCEQAFVGSGVAVVPAPSLPFSELQLRVPCTFSDILHDCGYSSPARVTEAVGQWLRIIDELRPDRLLADYSPTAMLAARIRGVRKTVIGTGFTCPPDVTPLPSLHEQVTEPHWAAEVEAAVLASMNAALESHGGTSLDYVAQLYADADRQVLLTLPELDHYPSREAGEYVRPFGALPATRTAWPVNSPSPRVFVYLRNEPSTEPLLRGLAMKGITTIAYVYGLSGACIDALTASSVTVFSTPVDLRPLVEDCDVAVLNGGHVAACEFLLAGTPMLTIPQTLEQAVTARRLREQGLGLDASVHDLNAIGSALEKLIGDTSYAEAARWIAGRYIEGESSGGVARVGDELR